MPAAGVIAVDWPPEVYKAHKTVLCRDEDGQETCDEMTTLVFRVDRTASDTAGVRAVICGERWEFPVHFTVGGMPQLQAVDQNRAEPCLKVGKGREPLLNFLKDHPLNFYLSDFSRVSGIEHFGADLKHDPYDRRQITVIDWAAAGVDITIECGPNSIQEHLKAYLLTPEHEVILHDHGTGEIADFVTVGFSGSTVDVKLYHVKGSGGAKPGNRHQVSDLARQS
jgi:hypothetical protein